MPKPIKALKTGSLELQATDYEQYNYNTNGYLYRILFNGTTVWQLTTMDDYGRIRQADIGGTAGTWSYDANNMLSQIAATGVQQYDYSFNVNTGNLNYRTNTLKTLLEHTFRQKNFTHVDV